MKSAALRRTRRPLRGRRRSPREADVYRKKGDAEGSDSVREALADWRRSLGEEYTMVRRPARHEIGRNRTVVVRYPT